MWVLPQKETSCLEGIVLLMWFCMFSCAGGRVGWGWVGVTSLSPARNAVLTYVLTITYSMYVFHKLTDM